MHIIINKELIGRGATEDGKCPPFQLNEPIGHLIYKLYGTIWKNMATLIGW